MRILDHLYALNPSLTASVLAECENYLHPLR